MKIRLIGGMVAAVLVASLLWGARMYLDFDPDRIDLAAAMLPPSEGHPLGTDELGRDLLGRFIVGVEYTLTIGGVTTIIAVLLGGILALAALSGLEWITRTIVILAYLCFIVPEFLLKPARPRRALVALLFLLSVLPASVIGLVAIALWNVTGVGGALVLGPGVAIAVAFTMLRSGRSALSDGTRHIGLASGIAPLLPVVLLWTVCAHAALEMLSLGAQPPQSSWGSILVVRSGSWWPNLAAGSSLLILGLVTIALSDGGLTRRRR